MPPGGVKPRPRKRVLADVPTSMRVTRSRKVSSQNADASAQSEEMYDPKQQTPSVIHKPSAHQTEEFVPNSDDHCVEVKFLTIVVISC